MNKEYTWNFNKDAELWNNEIFTTESECINDAKDYMTAESVVYVGEVVHFGISVDSEIMLDALEEEAFEFCGESSEGWNAYDHKKRDEINELNEQLSSIVSEWMKKYGYEPYFYAVENITQFSLEVQG